MNKLKVLLTLKPRNPVVVPARFHKAGPHRKTAKSLRRKAKQDLASCAAKDCE